MKYTNVDSNNVEILLNDLPRYSKVNNKLDSVKVLNKSALKFEISSTNNDSIFNIVTTQELILKTLIGAHHLMKLMMSCLSIISYNTELK